MRRSHIAFLAVIAGCTSVAQVRPIGETPVTPDPDPEPDPDPDPDPQLDDLVVDLAVAGSSACVTRASGTLECFGMGAFTHIMRGTPIEHGDLNDVVSSSGFVEQACVLHRDGGVSCWGWDHHLQFGGALARGEESTVPLRLPHVRDAAKLSSGHHHLCILTDAAQVACWGEPYSASLGPDLWRSESPAIVALPESVIVDVAASMEKVCAVGESGAVWCWGQMGGRIHELDDYSGHPVEIPMPIDAVGVSAGWQGACAWDELGDAWCWGALGEDGWPKALDIPPVAKVVSGDGDACALLQDGGLWCSTPIPAVLQGKGDFTHVAMSYWRSCAAHRTGHVACWDRDGLVWTELEGSF